jgi:hypothetical protein
MSSIPPQTNVFLNLYPTKHYTALSYHRSGENTCFKRPKPRYAWSYINNTLTKIIKKKNSGLLNQGKTYKEEKKKGIYKSSLKN